MAFIEGDDEANPLVGTADADVVFAYGGDDLVAARAGNDLVLGGSGDDLIYGEAGDDTLNGEEGDDALLGGDGSDTVSYAGTGLGVFVDLAAQQGTVGGETDTFSSIENALGSSFGDVLFGDAGANRLNGGSGDDLLRGGAGNDVLIGGAGRDTVWYTDATGGITLSLALGTSQGAGVGSDSLSGIENVGGSSFGDSITGNAAANALNGNGGSDVLQGGLGADSLFGGAGIDQAVYSDSTVGVTVLLDANVGQGGTAEGDTFSSIEIVIGSAHNDILYGDSGANSLHGSGGNDFLAGRGGADQLFGGDGVDQAIYFNSPAGVSVNLTTGSGTGGEAAGDILFDVEDLIGSAHADVLVGNDAANLLSGYSGNDVLEGDSGNDELYGNDGADLLYGNLDADALSGGAGNDDLRGGGGDDMLRGEAGNDTLRGSIGQDSLFGGDGADVLDFNLLEDSHVGALRDRVYGFVSGVDDIDLANIDANAALAGDQAFTYIGDFLFSGAAGELRYNGSILMGDVDGDALADFHIQLYGVPIITPGDLIL